MPFSVSKSAILLTKSPSNTHSVSKWGILLTKSLSNTHSVSKTAVLLTIRRTYPENRPSAVVLVDKSSPEVHKVESKVGDLGR